MTTPTEKARAAIVEFMAPNAGLGWPGFPEFSEDNARELVEHLTGEYGVALIHEEHLVQLRDLAAAMDHEGITRA